MVKRQGSQLLTGPVPAVDWASGFGAILTYVDLF